MWLEYIQARLIWNTSFIHQFSYIKFDFPSIFHLANHFSTTQNYATYKH